MTHNDTININEQNLTSRDLDRTPIDKFVFTF